MPEATVAFAIGLLIGVTVGFAGGILTRLRHC